MSFHILHKYEASPHYEISCESFGYWLGGMTFHILVNREVSLLCVNALPKFKRKIRFNFFTFSVSFF